MLESIASVISALPPYASIEPIKVMKNESYYNITNTFFQIIVNPILQGAVRALNIGVVSVQVVLFVLADWLDLD